jgi:uncharacterized protein (TIGR02147 family)
MVSPLGDTMTLNSFLSQKLEDVQKKNPRFSMRALAQKAGISPGRLNEIFHGRRPLSDHYLNKITYGLGLNHNDAATLAKFVSVRAKRMNSQKVLQQQELQMVTDWVPYAILNLMKTEDFESTPEWMAKRLALPVEQVQTCLDLLMSLKIIKWKNERLTRVPEQFTTTADIPSSAIIQGLSAHLNKATDVLANTPPPVRSYTTITMPTNVEKLEEAKQLIHQFRRKLCLLLEDGPKTEVYSLNIQLYPLTELASDKES